ncbi:MAG: hypothetical protein ABI638_06200, partial [Ignavibacteriota bacterium]
MTKYILLSLILISYLTLAQKTNIEVANNSFLISLDEYQPKFRDTNTGDFIIRDYFEFTNPSNKISYKLPSIDVYLAIPQNSKVNLSELNYDTEIQNKILPCLNPSLTIKDSGISYVENDYSKIVESETPNLPVEIVKYFFFREFYIVQIHINNYRF